MGEAKSRSEARRLARQQNEPEPVYEGSIRLRGKIVNFLPDIYAAFEGERAAFNAAHGSSLDFDGYLNAALEVFCERERQAREALAEAKRLADEAAAKLDTKVGTSVVMTKTDDVLSKMAPAVARSAAAA